LDTDQHMVSLWTQQAIADGVFTLFARHRYTPGGGVAKAARYRFTADNLEWFERLPGIIDNKMNNRPKASK
jgi:hypothetical protein